MASLHFTAGRLRKLVEAMSGLDAYSLTLEAWQELEKLVRLGTLRESEDDVVINLMKLILHKCMRDVPQIKALGFRILLIILLNISSRNTKSFLDSRAKQIVFLMLRSTVENKNCPHSVVIRSLADTILFKLLRQILNAILSFPILSDAFSLRAPDNISKADYPKYFHWIINNAEEDEITREQLKQFLYILERRWSLKRNYERRMFEILLKDMQEKFSTNILPDEKNTFIRLIGTSSEERVLSKTSTDDPITWVNYNNWTVPRYWVTKQGTKELKRSTQSAVPEPVQFEIKNSHNAEIVTCTSPASSYCSDCLEKKRMSEDHEHRQNATEAFHDTSGSIRRVEWKKPTRDAPNGSGNKLLIEPSQQQRAERQSTPAISATAQKLAAQRRLFAVSARVTRSDRRDCASDAKAVEHCVEEDSDQGLRVRSMSGSRSKSALPEKTRRSLG